MSLHRSPSQLYPGSTLPDLRLRALVSGEYGREYAPFASSEHRGGWLILTYWPLACLLACPGEITEFGRRFDDFAAAGATVFGIAPDTHAILHTWRSGRAIPGTLPLAIAEDRSGALAGLFGIEALGRDAATMIVDPNGTVRAVFQASQHTSQHPGDACRNLESVLWRLKELQLEIAEQANREDPIAA
ncbi:MAG: redoxin domain-containing protein [Planctomycetes bacterium]|nr:redoxin domain-containing protein [Planctomycetota bacterium]